MKKIIVSVCLCTAMAAGWSTALAARKNQQEQKAELTESGKQLEAKYAALLAGLKEEIAKALPVINEEKKSALLKAADAATAAGNNLNSAGGAADRANTLTVATGWWKKGIKACDKQIEKAEADLKAATTDADRETAKNAIAKAQQAKKVYEDKISNAATEISRLKPEVAGATQAKEAAKVDSAKALTNQLNAAKALLADVEPFLSSDKLDAKLVKATLLATATPNGLAEFAQQGAEQAALVEKLLADDKLMKEMLVAGGARYGKYGRAIEIYTAIQKASSKASEGVLQRLALATSLEHAMPIKQSNAAAQADTAQGDRGKDKNGAAETVDPVKRYLHYEKAYLDGELDPAFKNLNAWEMRMVVDCDAPDEILAWGREMLRTYRPDHIYTSNYGWRYSATVKTEVRYGSQGVKDDLPSLHNYQNIIKDGGVCGRRAFFGRFILRCFGIPVWGVTQHKHAALSHWTPKGWVVNLGAGFPHSWWDKDEASLSGSDFLLETQAREHGADYLKVLRAQWVSRILGEPAYNGRKKVDGGIWSSFGHYQTMMIASTAVGLGPLGQELGEANAPQELDKEEQATVTDADKKVGVDGKGVITIPAVAHGKSTGSSKSMKSYAGGMQIHCGGGFTTQYAFEAPQAGTYALSARVATVQEGQKFLFTANAATQPVEIAVPYTIGMWQQTKPIQMALVKGQNVLHFALKEGSRGVTIKEFTLTPVK